jgi:DNA-binding MarR family transcriptional regulator
VDAEIDEMAALADECEPDDRRAVSVSQYAKRRRLSISSATRELNILVGRGQARKFPTRRMADDGKRRRMFVWLRIVEK